MTNVPLPPPDSPPRSSRAFWRDDRFIQLSAQLVVLTIVVGVAMPWGKPTESWPVYLYILIAAVGLAILTATELHTLARPQRPA